MRRKFNYKLSEVTPRDELSSINNNNNHQSKKSEQIETEKDAVIVDYFTLSEANENQVLITPSHVYIRVLGNCRCST